MSEGHAVGGDLTAGLLARISEANYRNLKRFRRFVVADQAVGWIRHDQAERLGRFAGVFDVHSDRVALAERLDTPARRTTAVGRVVRELAAQGVVTGWRSERYPVQTDFGEPALFEVERAAADLFGVTGYGVLLNGYVETVHGQSMWIARRSSAKPTFPGMLDVLVGGGLPSGYDIRDCLIKEAEEEAGMPADLASQGRAVGSIRYAMERPLGLLVGVEFCFEVGLPADWRPQNRDGEVAAFSARPVASIMRQIATTRAFKPSSALSIIDFFQRHGYLGVGHPVAAAIRSGALI